MRPEPAPCQNDGNIRMMTIVKRLQKLFAGERLQRLREQHGMSQAALAHAVGLSASYFNQIEHDQRPLPPAVLRRLCDLFSIDVSYFSDSEELHLAGALREAMADPLFGGAAIDMAEMQAMVRAAPNVAHKFMTLYRHTLEREQQVEALPTPQLRSALGAITQFPYDEVRDWVQYHQNHFEALDRAAEALAGREGFNRANIAGGLSRYLLDVHDIRIADEPGLLQKGLVWRLQRDTRHLYLAEGASQESKIFWMAHHLGLIEQDRAIDRLVQRAGLSTEAARSLARVSLANYFAGAVMMPYRRFLEAAETLRYDIQRLQARFGASFEQVCHRLSTMQRPSEPGVPFYFVKTDISGNVLKRSSATRFQFTQFGGTCPLWNVYRTFGHPGEISVQVARTPDDVTYLNIACTVGRSGGHFMSRPRNVAVVLGCEISYAPKLVYAAGLDLERLETADPIGPGCRACSRTECRHRAMPAVGQALDIATSERGVLPYRVRDLPPASRT